MCASVALSGAPVGGGGGGGSRRLAPSPTRTLSREEGGLEAGASGAGASCPVLFLGGLQVTPPPAV